MHLTNNSFGEKQKRDANLKGPRPNVVCHPRREDFVYVNQSSMKNLVCQLFCRNLLTTQIPFAYPDIYMELAQVVRGNDFFLVE